MESCRRPFLLRRLRVSLGLVVCACVLNLEGKAQLSGSCVKKQPVTRLLSMYIHNVRIYRYDSITIMYIHYTYYVEKTRCIKGKHVVSILSRYKGKTRCSYKQDSMFLWDNKMKALQPSIFKHCAHTFWHMTMLAQSVYRHFQKGGIPKSSQVIY